MPECKHKNCGSGLGWGRGVENGPLKNEVLVGARETDPEHSFMPPQFQDWFNVLSRYESSISLRSSTKKLWSIYFAAMQNWDRLSR